jgi:hypothetical protein
MPAAGTMDSGAIALPARDRAQRFQRRRGERVAESAVMPLRAGTRSLELLEPAMLIS